MHAFHLAVMQDFAETEQEDRPRAGSGNNICNGFCQINSKNLIRQKQRQDEHQRDEQNDLTQQDISAKACKKKVHS